MRMRLPPKLTKRTGTAQRIYQMDPERLSVLLIAGIGASWIGVAALVMIILPALLFRFLWILGDLVQSNWAIPPGYQSYKEYFTVLFIPFSKYPYRAVAWAATRALGNPRVQSRLSKAPERVREGLYEAVEDMRIQADRSPIPTVSQIQQARDRALKQLRTGGSTKAIRAFERLDKKFAGC
jgi:hypothetical protein